MESAGGIVKALPLLGEKPFLVVNGDVWSDYSFDASFELGDALAHLVLVDNPDHNLKGDFSLEKGFVQNEGETSYTFSGIGYYSPKLFDGLAYGPAPLAPLLREAIMAEKVMGEHYKGVWRDIGTPARLVEVNEMFS